MKHPVQLWDVWRVFYGTYAQVDQDGDRKPVKLQGDTTLDHALRLAEMFGKGCCVKAASGL